MNVYKDSELDCVGVVESSNKQMNSTYADRKNSKYGDVRVEARVESLEKSMNKVDSEIQMMNKTMRDIADTLKEIKDDQKRIQSFEIQKAMLERDIVDNRKMIDVAFKKIDSLKDEVQKITVSNAGSEVKINNSERLFWLFVTAAVSAVSFFSQG